MPPAEEPLSSAPFEAMEVHRDVSSGTVRLRTTEWTRPGVTPEEPPIIALPGVLAPRLSFRPLALELSREFRVIAVDFPGLGESEKPSPSRYPYGISAFAEAIADMFAGLELSRAHVLGHGIGGAVALRLAARHPELVKRLALIAPHARSTQGQRALLSPVIGGLFLRQLAGRSWFTRMYRERINPEVTSDALTDYYRALSPPASRSALLATLRASQDPREVIADSRRVRAPALLIWGRDDRLFPVEHGRFLSREMPEAGLELFSCGHAPHEQDPIKTSRALRSFYAGRRTGSQ